MKDNFKIGFGLFGKMLVVALLSFFICFSIQFLCLTVFTEEIGYNAYGYAQGKQESESEHLYVHYYADGEDSLKAEYESSGYTVTTRAFRSELGGKGKVIYYLASQAITLILLIAFMSNKVNHLGSQDSNKVNFGRIKRDMLRGLKIGLIANLPYALLYICLIALKGGALKSMPVSIYALLNCHFFPLINIIVGGSTVAGELSAVQFVWLFCLLLIVPIITAVSYLLGYKGIDLYEKAVYSKEKKGAN